MCDSLLIHFPLPLAMYDRVRDLWNSLHLLSCIIFPSPNPRSVNTSVIMLYPTCLKVGAVRSLEFIVMLYSSIKIHRCLMHTLVNIVP